jgi:hypothetical protein
MSTPSIVIVARSEHVLRFRKRLNSHRSVAVFGEAESLKALSAILVQPPRILALDPQFVSTARGAGLVARIREEAHLANVNLRVLVEDEGHVPSILGRKVESPEAALLEASMPLARAGTRHSARFPMSKHVEVVVNGERGQLIDLSVTGAQILVASRLRPDQPIRITLVDGPAETRCQGVVAWSVVEPSAGAVRYRAGIRLVDSQASIVEAFCRQHGSSPDPTFGAA